MNEIIVRQIFKPQNKKRASFHLKLAWILWWLKKAWTNRHTKFKKYMYNRYIISLAYSYTLKRIEIERPLIFIYRIKHNLTCICMREKNQACKQILIKLNLYGIKSPKLHDILSKIWTNIKHNKGQCFHFSFKHNFAAF